MKEVVKSVIGESPDAELKQKINKIANQSAGMNVHSHHIHIHQYGTHIELIFHIYLPPKLDIQFAHELTDAIEKAIKKELNITATIHIEPKPE